MIGVQASSRGIDIIRKSSLKYRTFRRKEHEIWCFSTWVRVFIWPWLHIEARIFIRDQLRLRSNITVLQPFVARVRARSGKIKPTPALFLARSGLQNYSQGKPEGESSETSILLQRMSTLPWSKIAVPNFHSRNITELYFILVYWRQLQLIYCNIFALRVSSFCRTNTTSWRNSP